MSGDPQNTPNLIDLPVYIDNSQAIQPKVPQIPLAVGQYLETPDLMGMQIAQNKTKSVRKQKFSPDEDEKLKVLVRQYGVDWKIISAVMKNRSPRQCRDRWKNYLSPDVNNNPWTPQEDALLIEKIKEFGRQWATIAKFFPQRTEKIVFIHNFI